MGSALRGEAFSPENAVNRNARASQQAQLIAQYQATHPNDRIQDPGTILGGGGTGHNPYGTTIDAQGNTSYVLPYPNAPHDGGPQDQANTRAMVNSDAAYNNQQYAVANKPGFIDKLIPALAIGMATAGIGSAVGAGVGSAVGGTAGSIVGPAAGGATAGGLAAAVQGRNPLKPALIGGIGGGLGALAQPAAGALSNATGLSAPVASGLVRGAVGAGTGALGGALSGGNPANGALTGGLSGIASSLASNLTGNQALAGIGGTIGAGLAGKYLAGSSSPPRQPVAAAPIPASVSKAAPAVVPQVAQQATPTAAPGTAPQNIGAYSGFNSTGLGYQPMTQTNYANNTDFNNYGQGPQQSFFQPIPGT